jgi:hypothetical protein
VPTTSSVNSYTGATVANLVVSKLGTDGAVCLLATAQAHLVVDITGWFPAVAGYASMAPGRLMDTRAGEPTVDGADSGAGLRPAGTTTELTVAGRAGVPAGAATVVLNVTVTGTPSSGYLTVYPCGVERPLASNLNFSTWPGTTVANAIISKVGVGGKVCL